MTWCKKIIKYSGHFFRHSNNYYSSVIFNFTLTSLIIFYSTFFCHPVVCYLGFLAAISNTQIVHWMWFRSDHLPEIIIAFSYLKTNSSRTRIFRTRCRRVVNGPTSSGPNPAQTRKYKPKPGPNPKTNLNPKSCRKKPKS